MPQDDGPAPVDLAHLRIELKTLLEGIQTSMERREIASVERHAKLGGTVELLAKRVESVADDHFELRQIVNALESGFTKVQRDSSDAIASHSKLEQTMQGQWRSVTQMLQAQNDDLARREREKKEAREQESIAAKRVEAARKHEETMTQAKTPRIVAGLVLLGTVATVGGSYLSVRAAHEPTEAKITQNTQQLSSLQRRVETVAQAVDAPSDLGAMPAAPILPAPASVPSRSAK